MDIYLIKLTDNLNSVSPLEFPWENEKEPQYGIFIEDNFDLVYDLTPNPINCLMDKLSSLIYPNITKNKTNYLKNSNYNTYNELRKNLRKIIIGKQKNALKVSINNINSQFSFIIEESLDKYSNQIKKHYEKSKY